ncbi:hypothetical protein SAMN05428966_107232 [Massilia sp. PDC64]|nr:hypothetical protein [Massilia sp. PDC64]SDE19286.1 hypothetical protein SAMN05428966_107232 [Massilia sp. PDC64]
MSISCPGRFERGGSVESHMVTAVFMHGSLYLGADVQPLNGLPFFPKTKLTLSPFDPATLMGSVLQPVLGKTTWTLPDREWQIAGTHLGELEYGPLGHPADGEFEVRPVHAFTARVAYSPQKLSLEFSGRTESGFEVCHYAGKVEKLGLTPWEFRVRFEVGRESLQEFLQLPEGKIDSFLAQLDKR